METSDFTTFLMYLVSLLTAIASLLLYLRARQIMNAIMLIASKDFYDSANSLLKTPEDLPDHVVECLNTMNHMLRLKSAHWDLRTAIRMDRKGKLTRKSDHASQQEYLQMRPELRNIWNDATFAWLEIMRTRNVLAGLLINYELARLQVSRGKIGKVDSQETMKVMTGMDCAA